MPIRSFATLLIFFGLAGVCVAQIPDTSRAGNEKVAEIMRTFAGRGVMRDDSQPTPASEALSQFRVHEGFEIELVASEPEVSQPLFLSWDSRGRMWVVQYRQYQYPAGLKVIRYDQHLRAVFDKVPDPPPHGTPGADKITVFEDTDGDGQYDHQKDVITGLNIATAVQVGRGGIWVLNPPYLLFYPDADRNDVPDGDPEVHLSGFGLQDTHSVANSLTWGPDGWLYGSNGSTTVGDVSSAVTKGVRFEGQCIWRYHPDTKVFEIYAEGGGNTFSLEIDSKGRVFAGTNGGGTRGWYFPQGSYSRKNWGKHGPLTNPYAFGFFSPMPLEGDDRRFAQAFCIYEGGLYPESFTGSIIAPNSLQNLVWISQRIPDGSSFRTVDGSNLLESPDRWFRPVYAGVGPDGAVYLADWYDTRLSHVSPIDDWHKESGRVYRVVPTGPVRVADPVDLHTLSSEQLVQRLDDPNKWVRKRAVLELGWRGDRSVSDQLSKRVDTHGSMEALWVLNLMDEITDARAAKWLSHDDPHIRRWVVRALGDRHQTHSGFAALAARESDVEVRSQLAATARRLAAADALPIVRNLLRHSEDVDDPHMPLMNWWALETHADRWPEIESMFSDETIWREPLVQLEIIGRLIQRYASAGLPSDLEHCAALLELAPDNKSRQECMLGLSRAFQGRSIPPLPQSLESALSQYQSNIEGSGLVLAIRQGKADAFRESLQKLQDRDEDLSLRIELAKVIGEVRVPRAAATLIKLATGGHAADPALQRVAIRSLGIYDDDAIPKAIVQGFRSSISEEHDLRAAACRLLASRPAWAKALLQELVEWRLRRDQIPADVIQQLRAYEDPSIASQVDQAFGKDIRATLNTDVAEIKRVGKVLIEGSGNPQLGEAHFVRRCATCHQLFGQGKKVGPPLDGYDRGNRNFWLSATIAPSLEIREGFQSYLVLTNDGRVINGMIAAQDPQIITLRNADDRMTVIDRDNIDVLKTLDTSLMPRDLLRDMTDSELRDLFAYLMLGT